jgi:hypothetical protein
MSPRINRGALYLSQELSGPALIDAVDDFVKASVGKASLYGGYGLSSAQEVVQLEASTLR